jgi:antitoxin component HigA of HigAB toxin-antitoxin module
MPTSTPHTYFAQKSRDNLDRLLDGQPEPIEAILYYMESRGLTRQDLEPAILHTERLLQR